MTQEHTSDNTWRDKIGTQINLENGTYIENNINDIEQIKTAVSDWWKEENKQELFILVVCENKYNVSKIDGLSSILDYYGEDYKDWKPFKDEKIVDVIKIFCKLVTYKVKCIICNGFAIDDLYFWVNLEDHHLHKLIVVTDGLALSQDTIRFSSSIDHRNKVGGIIFTLDENIHGTERTLLRSIFKEKYPRMSIRRSGRIPMPYPNIVTNVSTKEDFISTLTALSEPIGIISEPYVMLHEFGRPGLDELNNDGS